MNFVYIVRLDIMWRLVDSGNSSPRRHQQGRVQSGDPAVMAESTSPDADEIP
jgi:hypothetical protein